nr:immunoglobulin heavy chain junction region [Macaca mulatta]MOX61031.1 immunoglobulin heavy chain junction region [Macaca mulatta]MOX62259.1 immunoglobulin heavy chain junction region [Macaca mulatta]MOX62463.1 immunoglobulin heavy chain junction region [Macaca mulatta]MOX65297.1 immunoglobulin heavy chain junction region [Macaca mulatta]
CARMWYWPTPDVW